MHSTLAVDQLIKLAACIHWDYGIEKQLTCWMIAFALLLFAHVYAMERIRENYVCKSFAVYVHVCTRYRRAPTCTLPSVNNKPPNKVCFTVT